MPQVKTRGWISLWFLLVAPIILWDTGYCFMRPRSMEGGDLHWIWKPYKLYQKIDYIYGVKALEEGNGFTNAQAFLNVIETSLSIAYLYLTHVTSWPPAIIIGFASAIMTLSKTVLYWAQEYFCNYCAIGHNSLQRIIFLWLLPNGLWIVVPGLIVAQLSKDLTSLFMAPYYTSRKVKS